MTSNSSGAASPSAPQEDHRVVQVEIVISWVLRIGVVTSLAVVVLGLALMFARRPDLLTSTTALQEFTQRGAAFPHTLTTVIQGISHLQGEAVIAIGLLLLILTPVARVAVSVLAFLYQRDHVFTLITLTVFIILLMSFVIGYAEQAARRVGRAGAAFEAAVACFPSTRRYDTFQNMSKFHTTQSAARYLGVTPARVRQLILEGRLTSEKYGRDHLISESDLKTYMATARKNPGRPRKNSLRVR